MAAGPSEPIRSIRAADGNEVRIVPVDEVACFQVCDKYLAVVTETDRALERMSLRELARKRGVAATGRRHSGGLATFHSCL